jgi:hypothetical protein
MTYRVFSHVEFQIVSNVLVFTAVDILSAKGQEG